MEGESEEEREQERKRERSEGETREKRGRKGRREGGMEKGKERGREAGREGQGEMQGLSVAVTSPSCSSRLPECNRTHAASCDKASLRGDSTPALTVPVDTGTRNTMEHVKVRDLGKRRSPAKKKSSILISTTCKEKLCAYRKASQFVLKWRELELWTRRVAYAKKNGSLTPVLGSHYGTTWLYVGVATWDGNEWLITRCQPQISHT